MTEQEKPHTMATAAKSISANNLAKFTQAAVRTVTAGPTRIVRGPIWGYILRADLNLAQQLEQATAVAKGIAANAKAEGVTGLGIEPAVIIKPGKILAGFIEREMSVIVR